MAANVMDLKARLDVDSSPFDRGLHSSEGRLRRFSSTTGRMLGGFARTAVRSIAVVGAAFAGMVIYKGAQRAVAIDDAERKLEGLGYTAQQVASITDDALKSVLGTPYSLAEALNVASNAMAAGVKPGQQLSHYLAIVADTASIAGTSMQEMGSVLNKATANVRVHTDVLNSLADRGLPIFTWLQKEYGVTGDALRKMVEDGKVDAKTLMRVIEENIGGAAQKAGEGIRGSFQNLMTALARLGDAFLGPIFGSLPKFLQFLRDEVDKLTMAVKPLGEAFAEVAQGVGAKWPRIKEVILEVFDALRTEVWPILMQLVDIFRASFDAIVGVINSHREALSRIWVNLKDLIRSLMPVIRFIFVQVLPVAIRLAIRVVDRFIQAIVLIKDTFVTVTVSILGLISKILGGLSTLMHAAGKVPGRVGQPFRDAAESIDNARQKVDNLQDRVNNLHSKTIHINAVVSGLGYVAALQEHIALMQSKTVHVGATRQHGGPVSRGSSYLVGERGPELFVPRMSGSIVSNDRLAAAGGGTTINLYANVVGGREAVIRWLEEGLERQAKRNGG